MASRFTLQGQRILGRIEVCDRCGIRAHVRVVLVNGGEIYLCRAHTDKHLQALKEHRSTLHKLPT